MSDELERQLRAIARALDSAGPAVDAGPLGPPDHELELTTRKTGHAGAHPARALLLAAAAVVAVAGVGALTAVTAHRQPARPAAAASPVAGPTAPTAVTTVAPTSPPHTEAPADTTAATEPPASAPPSTPATTPADDIAVPPTQLVTAPDANHPWRVEFVRPAPEHCVTDDVAEALELGLVPTSLAGVAATDPVTGTGFAIGAILPGATGASDDPVGRRTGAAAPGALPEWIPVGQGSIPGVAVVGYRYGELVTGYGRADIPVENQACNAWTALYDEHQELIGVSVRDDGDLPTYLLIEGSFMMIPN